MGPNNSQKEALRTEDKQLRDYELVFILSPEVGEDNIDAVVNNLNRFITNKGGVISDEKRWGKRKLAYPIKRHSEGNYVLTRLKLKPAVAKELDAYLKISEEVIRHLLVKVGS